MGSILASVIVALLLVACADARPSSPRVAPERTFAAVTSLQSPRPVASGLSASQPTDAFAELAARPLAAPAAQVDRCPASSTKEIDERIAPAMGDGPIYAVMGSDAVWSLEGAPRGAFNRYSLKTLWVSTDPSDERILLRIFNRFNPEPPVPGFAHGMVLSEDGVGTQLRLGPEGSVRWSPGPMPEGWRSWSSAALVPGPGCYAFQIDTERATEHLYFEVTP